VATMTGTGKMQSVWGGGSYSRHAAGQQWLPNKSAPPSLYILPARPFGDAQAAELAKELSNDDRLEDLYASGHRLGLSAVMALAGAIAQHPRLKSLCIGDGQIGCDATRYQLMWSAAADGRWRVQIQPGPQASPRLGVLVDAVCRNASLESVDFENKAIGPAGLEMLARQLSTHQTLRRLKLGRNAFGNTGILRISQQKKFWTDITDLELHENSIDTVGSAVLSSMLGGFESLQRLKLCGNPLGGWRTAEQLKEDGNAAFASKDYAGAIVVYSDALRTTGDPGTRCALCPRPPGAVRRP
jgi:hypothetical protein